MNRFARVALLAAATAAYLLLSSLAQAKVHITVDLDAQTIHVESKAQTFDWKVSSGKPGFETPAGTFGVLWMDKDHHSDEYEQAPMPNAIFFAPGYAIHGFTKSAWGHAASHGCVRLPVAKAAILFDLVKAEGAEINVTGYSPVSMATIREKRQRDQAADASAPRGSEDGAYYAPVGSEDDAYAPRSRRSRDDDYGYSSAPEMRPVRGSYAPSGSVY